jgi:multiple sugar transport system ATP-binding protein
MIYVTHDQVEAMTLADKIVVLRDGCIEQVGSPMDLYNNPSNQFVAGFLGSPAMNFVAADVLGGPKGQVIGVRPEYLRLEDAGRIAGRVTHVEKLGSDTNVLVEANGANMITVRLFGQHDIAPETNVRLDFDDRDGLRFDAEGRRVRSI